MHGINVVPGAGRDVWLEKVIGIPTIAINTGSCECQEVSAHPQKRKWQQKARELVLFAEDYVLALYINVQG